MSDKKKEALGDETCTSADGKFQCVVAHAVEVAYMMNCLEAAYERAKDKIWARQKIQVMIVDYLSGNMGTGDVMCSLEGDW